MTVNAKNNRHFEGRERAQAFLHCASRPERPCGLEVEHKVPHPCSGADESAPSLTGFGMTNARKESHIHGHALLVARRLFLATLRLGFQFQRLSFIFLPAQQLAECVPRRNPDHVQQRAVPALAEDEYTIVGAPR